MRIGAPQFFQAAGEHEPDLFAPAWVARASSSPDDDADAPLFSGGPPTRFQTLLGLMRPGKTGIRYRIAAAVAVGWLPLLLLALLQTLSLHDGSLHSFLVDYGVHARSLLAVPLLIAAEPICLTWLSMVGLYIRTTGLVGPFDAPAFNRIVRSTRHLQHAAQFEIAVLTVAATVIATLMFTVPARIFPSWHWMFSDGRWAISPMGWWHDFISVPLLLILLVGWIWRLFVWTRFLFLVARLPLRIVPAHPDGAGGLMFVGLSIQAFAPVAFAVGVIAAGTVANRVMHDNASLLSFKLGLLGLVIILMVLFVSPLTVFVGPLIQAWRRGTYEYGALARGLGLQMERRWLGHGVDADALGVSDFSATTDLYSIVNNAYSMRVMPLGLKNLAVLLISILLPFLPVLLMAVSPEVLLQDLTKLLL
jgi:hypothetical protein